MTYHPRMLANDISRCSNKKCPERKACARAYLPTDPGAKYPVSFYDWSEGCDRFIPYYVQRGSM